jgi:hypothetical protein
VRIGGDRVAAHRFGAHAQRRLDPPTLDQLSRLQHHLDAGAANALHQMRRPLHRYPGIKPDMARRHIGVERGLGHRAGDGGADIGRIEPGLVEHGACDLDAEIDRRDRRQHAGIVDKRRARAVEQPGVIEAETQALRGIGHVGFSLLCTVVNTAGGGAGGGADTTIRACRSHYLRRLMLLTITK